MWIRSSEASRPWRKKATMSIKYKEKQGFVVKKSTKVLTVPASFNLNTDRRLQDRSLSKSREKLGANGLTLDQEIMNFQGVVQARDSGRESRRGKGMPGEAQESSLLDKLIREYDLENVYKDAKCQINPKTVSYGSHSKTLSNGNASQTKLISTVKFEDCYIPQQ